MPIIYANILQPLISPLEAVMVFIHNNLVGGSWGLAIVGLTIIVRAILLPLTLKQVKSMQELQRLAPEIKALQAKYKEDKQRLNQEMMKLYQEHKVNPFGSCLPLVAQLPVFFALFYMLRQDLKLDICKSAMQRGAAQVHQAVVHYADTHSCNQAPGGHGTAKFLFIPDITSHAVGGILAVLIVLYIGSQLASSLLMSMTADRNQRLMMLGLPLIFTVFIASFPAGLIVYWITTNLWTIVQQYIVRRTSGPMPAPAAAPAGAADGTPVPANGGGLGLGRLLRGAVTGDGAAGKTGAAGKAGAAASSSEGGRVATAPPRPPRKKKKRSGRRR